MKAIIAAVIALTLTGCNIGETKQKEMDMAKAVNMCKNMSFSLVHGELSKVSAIDAHEMRDAIMKTSEIECERKVMIYTLSVKVVNKEFNREADVSQKEINEVMTKLWSIGSATDEFANKAAHFHTK
ncbi:hypothetical protein [Escherichia phage TR1]|nr:hypothetical protein [Escherichia phage TR1]